MIVCLGWGSLCWDPRDLALGGEWSNDGPILPVEFARISSDRRITLVLAEDRPQVPVLWAPLAVSTMEEAVSALGVREGVGAPFGAIGLYRQRGESGPFHATIGAWADQKGFAGVVWTALKPGLGPRCRGFVPSLDQLREHIASLDAEERVRALEYVLRAPEQIATPYRVALQKALAKS